MRNYNRRILTALVVAYKRGIINKKPLNKWLSVNQIFYRSIKYVSLLILFTFIFIILDKQIFNYFDINKNIFIGEYIIKESRIFSGFMIGVLSYNFYRLVKYIYQVYIVNKTMKSYTIEDGDVEKINPITFKIHI